MLPGDGVEVAAAGAAALRGARLPAVLQAAEPLRPGRAATCTPPCAATRCGRCSPTTRTGSSGSRPALGASSPPRRFPRTPSGRSKTGWSTSSARTPRSFRSGSRRRGSGSTRSSAPRPAGHRNRRRSRSREKARSKGERDDRPLTPESVKPTTAPAVAVAPAARGAGFRRTPDRRVVCCAGRSGSATSSKSTARSTPRGGWRSGRCWQPRTPARATRRNRHSAGSTRSGSTSRPPRPSWTPGRGPNSAPPQVSRLSTR